MNCIYIKYTYTGVVDSSGVRIYYTDQTPQQTAGIFPLGHNIMGHMIIPPRVERYTVTGYCSKGCTNSVSIYGVVTAHMFSKYTFCQAG